MNGDRAHLVESAGLPSVASCSTDTLLEVVYSATLQ